MEIFVDKFCLTSLNKNLKIKLSKLNKFNLKQEATASKNFNKTDDVGSYLFSTQIYYKLDNFFYSSASSFKANK